MLKRKSFLPNYLESIMNAIFLSRCFYYRPSLTGATTITLKPLAGDFKEIEIDAGEMTIKSVNLAGGPPLKFDYWDDEFLKNLPPGIPEGIARQFVGDLINKLKSNKPSDNND